MFQVAARRALARGATSQHRSIASSPSLLPSSSSHTPPSGTPKQQRRGALRNAALTEARFTPTVAVGPPDFAAATGKEVRSMATTLRRGGTGKGEAELDGKMIKKKRGPRFGGGSGKGEVEVVAKGMGKGRGRGREEGPGKGEAEVEVDANVMEKARGPGKRYSGGRKKVKADAQALGVFVSNYYSVGDGDVERYLDRHGVAYRKNTNGAVVEECPFCHETRGEADNLYKLHVQFESGVFYCHRCRAKGNWFLLRDKLGGGAPSIASFEDVGRKKNAGKSGKPVSVPAPTENEFIAGKERLWKEKAAERYLTETRGLSPLVLRKYGVGVDKFHFDKSQLCFTFPMFDKEKNLVRFKVRSVEKKANMRLNPKGGAWGLFGLDTVPDDAKEVIVTEGEFDAMAAHQATGMPAVSLPNGASSLPPALLPALERFRKIYLWMDDDMPGRDGAQQFSKKLGVRRCVVVRTNTPKKPCKDANDALLMGLDLKAIVHGARITPHEGVASFADLREEVFAEFTNSKQMHGVKSNFLPQLNKYLNGHRRGELSIFTGHTGVGKTTLLSQMSLDYCMQGVPTLWGSFEISDVRIARLLLSQFYFRNTGNCVSGLVTEFDEWADKFSALPMYFMRYFGSNPINRVLDAMEYSMYAHDCTHVLLDNLQFMTSGQGKDGFDRFEVMDDVVAKLRRFSTVNNAHVSLVVHPRKENDDKEIETASIFGSAKSTQEADNVFILQRLGNGTMALDLKKNRFNGVLGRMPLRFSKKGRVFEGRDAPTYKPKPELVVTRAERIVPASSPIGSGITRPTGVLHGGENSATSDLESAATIIEKASLTGSDAEEGRGESRAAVSSASSSAPQPRITCVVHLEKEDSSAAGSCFGIVKGRKNRRNSGTESM